MEKMKRGGKSWKTKAEEKLKNVKAGSLPKEDKTSFPSTLLSIQETDEFYSTSEGTAQMKMLLARRLPPAWDMYKQKNRSRGFAWDLIRFVESHINSIVSYIVGECVMKLSLGTFQYISETLVRIPSITFSLHRKREQLEAVLSEYEKELDKKSANSAMEKSSMQVYMPAWAMIDYLDTLYECMTGEDRTVGNVEEYYRNQLMQGYFDLTQCLVLYTPSGDSDAKRIPLSDPTPDAGMQLFLDEQSKIPLNTWIILEFRLVQELIPYYFKAKFETQQEQGRVHNAALQTGSPDYPQEVDVDQQLELLCMDLLASKKSPELNRLMKEAKRTLVTQYITKLEAKGE